MSDQESVGDAENDLEIILDGEQPDYLEDQDEAVIESNENQENADDESKKAVKPKRVVKNPQPKLNEQTLKGPRGLAAIESYFERVKFKGRGYEEQDLDVLLKTYEYWCHRLFPKFPFDNCIERLEKLGTKRATQTHIKRIRMDLNFDEPQNTILRDEEEVNDTEGFVDTYNDQFDQLATTEPEITEEQLERMRQNMEKARRLREEKLRQIALNSQNILEVHDQRGEGTSTSNENGQNGTQNESLNNMESNQMEVEQIDGHDFSSTIVESGNKDHGNICEIPSQSNPDGKTQSEDNEDDIDNILDFINTDDTNESDLPTNIQHSEDVIKSKNDLQEETESVSNMGAGDNSQENIHSNEDNTDTLMEGTT